MDTNGGTGSATKETLVSTVRMIEGVQGDLPMVQGAKMEQSKRAESQGRTVMVVVGRKEGTAGLRTDKASARCTNKPNCSRHT